MNIPTPGNVSWPVLLFGLLVTLLVYETSTTGQHIVLGLLAVAIVAVFTTHWTIIGPQFQQIFQGMQPGGTSK